jgi:pimeloyl-ACP methyl ester carboxylesterase
MSKETPASEAEYGFRESVISVRTADGYLLEGLEINAPSSDECVVWTHGVYASFYAPPGLEVGRALGRSGISCVLGNNRGHNVGAWMRRSDGEVLLAGGAWERLKDAQHDIRAWIDFSEQLGSKALLAGHSLGARKVAAYMAETQDPRVAGVLLVSPSSRKPGEVDERLGKAQEKVAEGAASELLPIHGEFAMSAQTYADHQDPTLRIDNAFFDSSSTGSAISKIRVPLLLVLGERERRTRAEAEADLNDLAEAARDSKDVSTALIDNAGHIYSAAEGAVAEAIAHWVQRL